MKKILLLFFVYLIFNSIDAASPMQHPGGDPVILLDSICRENRYNEQGLLMPSSRSFFYYENINSKDRIEIEKKFIPTSGEWENIERTEIYYDDSLLHDTKIYSWQQQDSTWLPSLRFVREYNNAGSLLSYTKFAGNEGVWAMIEEHIYEYNANELLIEYIINYNFGPFTITEKEYNENDLLILERVYQWSDQINDYYFRKNISYHYENDILSQRIVQQTLFPNYPDSLRSASKDEYFIDQSMNVIEEVNYTGHGFDDWVPVSRIVSDYDNNNNRIELIAYIHNSSYGTWEAMQKQVFEYNTHNQLTVSYYYPWIEDGEWMPVIKRSRSYQDLKEVEMIEERWNGNEFEFFSKTSREFDDDFILSWESSSWRNQEWSIDMADYYYYSEYHNTVSVQEDLQQVLTIYPNPARDIVYVKNAGRNSTLRIFDLKGQQIITKHYISDHELVHISELQPGVYIIEVNGKTRKFIKN